jgi:hypothetical protein
MRYVLFSGAEMLPWFRLTLDSVDEHVVKSVHVFDVLVSPGDQRMAYMLVEDEKPETVQRGDHVLVELEHGMIDSGVIEHVYTLPLQVTRKLYRKHFMGRVFRKLTRAELASVPSKLAAEEIKLVDARKIARRMKLGMEVSNVHYRWDRSEALLYYQANNAHGLREVFQELSPLFPTKTRYFTR